MDQFVHAEGRPRDGIKALGEILVLKLSRSRSVLWQDGRPVHPWYTALSSTVEERWDINITEINNSGTKDPKRHFCESKETAVQRFLLISFHSRRGNPLFRLRNIVCFCEKWKCGRSVKEIALTMYTGSFHILFG